MNAQPITPRDHDESVAISAERRDWRQRPIAACTFDCYGTLIDWRAGIEQTLGRTLRALGLARDQSIFQVYEQEERHREKSYTAYHEVLASSALGAAEKLGIRLPAFEARAFAESVPAWPAFPDSAEVLRELGRRGVQRFILSNVDRDILQETIRRNGLEVDGFVTAEDVGSYKPTPSHWTQFFQDHPLERTDVLHVANSLFHDIAPAQELGLQTVWVNRYHEAVPESLSPTYTIGELSELTALSGL